MSDVATASVINRFDAFVKEHTTKKSGDADAILDQVRKCKNANPSIFEAKKVQEFLTVRAKTVSSLVGQYISARMTVKYPLLDDALFSMKRHLIVTPKGTLSSDRVAALDKLPNKTDIRVTIPLFAEVPLEGPYGVDLGGWSRKTSRVTNNYGDREYKTHTGTVKSTLPEPPQDIKQAGRKAIGYYYNIVSEMYADDDLSEVLPTEPRSPELSIIWIPSPKALGLKIETTVKVVKAARPEVKREPVVIPKNYDPALLLRINKLRFLVKTYDIVDEEPLINFLREFSTGGKFNA
jgi:hypothetical protein